MSLSSGQKLGPYEIVAPLGAGGMGEVWRARDPRLGRDVAIKALPAAFASDAERLSRFRREAQALAALNHPNVAAIYGLEDGADAPHLVLELVPGETLAARLERGALSLRDTIAIAVQVAAAIEAAHERSIVHRDLKPGNVMVAESGAVKVLDFGLARSEAPAALGPESADDATRTAMAAPTEAGVILGTAAYMSPEQARGHAVDRRSDVWSFGCVLYECLAGRPPFAGETASDLIARILEREPDWTALPAGTPVRVREILRRCLRKHADERPRDIRDVRLELAEIAAGGAKAAPDPARSIAVLPFENQGGTDEDYFADGVTDEILNALAQLGGLRVAARSSCFAFKGRREDPRAVGERLGVTTVLEGAVRRAGQRLRITAQLVNVADGMQLWSERYDRELTDVFAVQDEIAAAIAKRLSVSLQVGEGGRRGTSNLEAYERMLKGRAFQLRRGRYLADAIECFERAIALDPEYAEAMAWLADSWRLLGTFGIGAPHEMFPKAKAMAERALAIDAQQAEAWATLADVELQYEWRWESAEAAWRKAFAIDPRHTRGRCERGLWGWGIGALTLTEADAEIAAAVEDDPHNSWAIGMLSFGHGFAGRHAESIAEARRAFQTDADSVYVQWNLVRALAWAGEVDEALATCRRLLGASGRHPWMLATLAWLFGRRGERVDARAVFDEMVARSRFEAISLFRIAQAAWAAGLPDEALAWVERAIEARDPVCVLARRMPDHDEMFADSRIDARMRAAGR